MAAMSRYALLLAPSANRVYADQAARISRAELAAFSGVVAGDISDIDEATLGGVPYLVFDADLGERDIAYLSNLSAGYALFERVDDHLLRPVTLSPLARFDSDLITIPKYVGKTNEQFTKLLLNLTVLASASADKMIEGPVTVCDPLCGRGTTLTHALMYGYDAIGVEIDARDVEATEAFLKTYLRRKRFKHTAEMVPVRRGGKRAARRLDVTVKGDRDQKVTVLQADTTQLDGLIRRDCADVLVTDLPYGIQHGSHHDDLGLTRSPLDLLERAVPVWLTLLRTGGALGFSWNLKVAKRALAEDILLANGLEIVPEEDLAHRVDQGIVRDVLIARKTG
jgi:SAM-dependent methyltransferase